MQHSKHRPFVTLSVVVLGSGLGLAPCRPVWAEAVTDGTVGPAATLSGTFAVPQNLGTTVGSNLFHSFATFNVNTGESATFTGDSGIANVISRVTGNSASTIDGALTSQVGTADFYFINPHGVVFGANAQVDVPGSFHVSTASELKFADGAVYSAANPSASTLTAAAPEAFGFLGNEGDIQFNGPKTVTTNYEQTNTYLGNDVIEYTETNLTTGDTTSGTYSNVDIMGNPIYTDADIGVAHTSTYSVDENTHTQPIAIGKGETLDVVAANISADGIQFNGTAATVRLDAVGQTPSTVSLNDHGATGTEAGTLYLKDVSITSSNYDFDTQSVLAGYEDYPGRISLIGNDIILERSDTSFSTPTSNGVNPSYTFLGLYNAGTASLRGDSNIAITANHDLSAVGGFLDITFGNTFNITAYGTDGSLFSCSAVWCNTQDGAFAVDATRQSSAISFSAGNALSLGQTAISTGGAVDIASATVSLNGSYLSSHALNIIGGDVSLTDVFAYSADTTSTVSVSGDNVSFDGGSVYASTVLVSSKHDIVLADVFNWAVSGLSLNSLNDINIDNSYLSYSVNGVQLTAKNDITISGSQITSVSPNNSASTAKGITIDANTLTLTDSVVTADASSFFSCDGSTCWDVTASAGDILVHLTGGMAATNSSLTSAGNAYYGAGNIKINADFLTLDNSIINVDNYSSAAGNIDISTAGDVYMTDSQISASSSTGAAGNIALTSGGTVAMVNSAITTSVADVAAYDGYTTASADFWTSSYNGANADGSYSFPDGSTVSADLTLTYPDGHTATPTSSELTSDIYGNIYTYAYYPDGSGFSTVSSLCSSACLYTNNYYVEANGYTTYWNGGDYYIVRYDGAKATWGAYASIGDIYFADGSIAYGNGTTVSASGTTTYPDGSIIAADGSASFIVPGFTTTTTTGNAGSITVSADSISISGNHDEVHDGILSVAGTGSTGDAGSISVTAVHDITLTSGAQISSSTYGVGNAGDVSVSADNITIEGAYDYALTGIYSSALTDQSGNAGSITVNASGALTLSDRGEISNSVYGTGNANSIAISAGSLSIDGGSIGEAGIYSAAESGSTGNAGSITVSVNGDSYLTNGGTISSSSAGSGNAGQVSLSTGGVLSLTNGGNLSSSVSGTGSADAATVTVSASSIGIDGGGNSNTGIFSAATGSGSGGAGDIVINAMSGWLSLANGGQINTSAAGWGDAGSIVVNPVAGLWIDGGGIYSSAETGSTGNAGSITVSVDGDSYLTNGGAISSSSAGSGNAGQVSLSTGGALSLTSGGNISSSVSGTGSADAATVTVAASSIGIDGGGNTGTGIFSAATGSGSGGAGDIVINSMAGWLSLANGGQINTSAWGWGDAGSIVVNPVAGLWIDGGGIYSSAESGSSGNAGSIAVSVDGDSYLTNGGTISSSSAGSGNAGQVSLSTGGALSLTSGGNISSSVSGTGSADAATVTVTAASIAIDGGGDTSTGLFSAATGSGSGGAGDIVINSMAGWLSLANGGQINTSAWGWGDAGSILVNPVAGLWIDGGGIYSSAETGSSGNAGSITVSVNGDSYLTNGGAISSSSAGSGNAGQVSLSTGGALSLTYGGNLSSSVSGTGSADAATVTVAASSIGIDGGGDTSTGLFSAATGSGSGAAGDIVIEAMSGWLSLANGGQINTSAAGWGDAGSILINPVAGLWIDGGSTGNTGIYSSAESGSSGNAGSIAVSVDGDSYLTNGGTISSSSAGSGNAGQVSLSTGGGLSLTSGGNLSTSASGTGSAGAITVAAGNVTVDGGGNSNTGLFSAATGADSAYAGDITLNTPGTLSLLNGGRLSTSAYGLYGDGAIAIGADALYIDGGSLGLAGIYSTAEAGSSATAGAIYADISGNATLVNGGALSSSSSGTGNAGTVTLNANNVTLAQSGQIVSDAYASGNAGTVTVNARNAVDIKSSGQISSSTYGAGAAGNVNVSANTVTIDAQGAAGYTGIAARAGSGSGGQAGNVTVNAGSEIRLLNGGQISISNDAWVADPSLIRPSLITLTAPDITLIDSEISASATGNVDAGGIVVNFSHELYLDPSFITTAANVGNGGDIAINGGELIYLQNSGFLTSVSGANGNGGDISVTADTLVMETGVIQANAVGGSGGNISLSLGALITSGNMLTLGGEQVAWQPYVFGNNVIQAASASGVSGTVTSSAPQLNLSGVLANLGGPQFDLSSIGQDYCEVGTGSSLSRRGNGGLPVKSSNLQVF